MARLPVLFISHGSPFSAFTKDETSAFWNKLGNAISRHPSVKAILFISAHWEEKPLKVNSVNVPETIYDFYGFPSHFYQYKYPGKGAPHLAERVAELLLKQGISIAKDSKHGLDHGTWVPLKWMLPSGNIPVVQLSLLSGGGPGDHVKIGKALAPLRDEGILIVGSGAAVHNLMDWRMGRSSDDWVADYVKSFDDVLDNIVSKEEEERNKGLIELQSHPLLRKAHPSLDHLLPLHVAGGAAGKDVGKKLFDFHQWSFSWGSYAFGSGLDLI